MQVAINITKSCNLRCPECYLLEEIQAKEGTNTHIDFNSLKNILNKVNFETVSLCGGEPLLHPQILDILTWFSHRTNKLTIATNGILIDSVADFLIENNILVQWSIRSRFPEVYKKIEYYIQAGMRVEPYYLPEDKNDFLVDFFMVAPSVQKLRILYDSKNIKTRVLWHKQLKEIHNLLTKDEINVGVEVEIGFLPIGHKISEKIDRGANHRIMIDSDCFIYDCPLSIGVLKGVSILQPNLCNTSSCPILKQQLDDSQFKSVCPFILAKLDDIIRMIDYYEKK